MFVSLSRVSLEWGCVHLYPSPTGGRPTERRAAFREVEPHAERQVRARVLEQLTKTCICSY